MIEIKDLTLQIGTQELLKDVSVTIWDKKKIGIVGSNGCGKSTFFKLLQGEIEAAGDVTVSSYERICYVEQVIENTSLSVLEYVLQKDKQLMLAKKAYDKANDFEKPLLLDELERLGYSSAPSRVAEVLSGLGFKNEDLDRPVSDFSGGWQMRLNLAGALFQPSTLLLLDEPTNHLDLESVIWLQNYLKKYAGTLLLISHDKTILNEICSDIIVFQDKKLNLYSGNYDTYLRTKELQQKVLQRQVEKEKEKREHLESFINRFRYKASKAKQAQSRLKVLEKMGEMPEIYIDKEERFSFPEPYEVLPPLVSGENICLGYDDNIVLRRVSFSIGESDRIALLGQNGNGKSTFVKFLAGVLEKKDGNVFYSPKLKVGYFSQHQEDELPLLETPVSYFLSLMKPETETSVRSYLASFGLIGEKALTEIKRLSGGEKTRLLFAKIALLKPNLLILDEPTNHLDIKGREALAEALNSYKGSVILITHDFSLVEQVSEDLWLIKDGKCQPFDGDLSDYKDSLLIKKVDKEKQKEIQKQKQRKEEIKQNQAQKRKLKADISQIEREMKTLTQEKEDLEKLFETPLNPNDILRVSSEIKEKQKQLDLLEEKWFLLYEEL